MPYHWTDTDEGTPARPGVFSSFDAGDAPLHILELRPHRSLPLGGFATFILITFFMSMIPLLGLLGTPMLWVLLPFVLSALALVWLALRRSYRDGGLREVLTIWSDRITLVRHETNGQTKNWSCNPFWLRIDLRETGGPVENYLTLKGSDRTVELGAFLSPEERVALKDELERRVPGA